MRTFAAVCLVLVLAVPALAGNGHYLNGLEGIRSGTVPPPGFYLRTYAVTYNADTLRDDDGDELDLGYDLDVAALAFRPIWITDWKILGANYGMHAIIPIQYTHVEIDKLRLSDTTTGIGDIDISPLILAWHTDRFDFSLGYEIFLPTGKYDNQDLSSPGKNYWTHMFSAGATAYLDKSKTWSVSALSRYEVHTENTDTDIRYGDDFQVEWGVGKKLGFWELGVSGYCHWQVTDDSGDGVAYDKALHDRNFAVGPEINYFIAPWKLNAGIRVMQEFGAKDSPEGIRGILTLTKIF